MARNCHTPARQGKPGKQCRLRQKQPMLAVHFQAPGVPQIGLGEGCPCVTLQELGFQEIYACKQVQASIGLAKPHNLECTAFHQAVAVGSSGHEAVVLVSGFPPAVFSMPRPKFRGLAKSIESAFVSLDVEDLPPAARWRFACNLGVSGFVSKQDIAVQVGMKAERNISILSCFSEVQDKLVWHGFIEHGARQLQALLASRCRSNPLLDHVGLDAVSALPMLVDRDLAALVLTELSKFDGFQQGMLFGAGVVFAKGAPNLSNESLAGIFNKITGCYKAGEGISKAALRETFASNLNVVSYMFDALWLVESPDGYVFSRQELEGFLAGLHVKRGDKPPGTRKIKDTLGLQRKKAEGLQELIAEWYRQANQGSSGGAG